MESGKPVAQVCREQGVSEQTVYRWRSKYSGMDVAELRRLKELDEENRRLKEQLEKLKRTSQSSAVHTPDTRSPAESCPDKPFVSRQVPPCLMVQTPWCRVKMFLLKTTVSR